MRSWSNLLNLFLYWAAVNETPQPNQNRCSGNVDGHCGGHPWCLWRHYRFPEWLVLALLICFSVDTFGGAIFFIDSVAGASMARGGRLIFARAFRDDDPDSGTSFRTDPFCAGKLPDSSVVFIYWDDLGIRNDHVGR